jgi:ribosomal protein S18 acetylase RimI-like enzyme
MTTLRPMQAQTFPAYLEAAIVGYARDNVEAGRWPAVGALERSRDDFQFLLPRGLDTPDNFLFEILDGEAGSTVGFVWYAIERKHGACAAYVYDLEIKAEHRRQGHALRALRALEAQAAASGAASIGLNVFADNVAAQSLYRRLGYAPTNINMYKSLADGLGCPLPAPEHN